MFSLVIAFWFCLFIVWYAYIGYGALLFGLVRLKRFLRPAPRPADQPNPEHLPEVTVLIAAYNEAECITEKLKNTLALAYPAGKLKVLVVTDGSSDGTPDLVKQYPSVTLLHQPVRQGKIAAVQRALPLVSTDLIVFTDANTLLNREAVCKLVRHYADGKVGAVAGEKRIAGRTREGANGAGEGIYWKYESALKRWDSELYSVVGAAGELFSIRRELFEAVPYDTLIEDFYLTLRIAQRGYRVRYEPEAYAIEGPSASVGEELKRKIRIATGGLQAVVRLKALLNPFRYGLLSFQYVSHRVLRWTLAPLALLALLLTSLVLAAEGSSFFRVVLLLQILFYAAALVGKACETRKIRIKALFVPYYFSIMNYAVYVGMARFITGSQSVLWEKAKRAKV